MRMQKKQFRIGELSKRLNVERFVIRFWEKEFKIKAHRSDGGQRFYEEKDFNKFQKIKQLLYKDGFTINGARQKLIKEKKIVEQIICSHKTTIENEPAEDNNELNVNLSKKLILFRKKLIDLKKQL